MSAYILGITAVLLGAYTFFFKNTPAAPVPAFPTLPQVGVSVSSIPVSTSPANWNPGPRIKSSGCLASRGLPDRDCTPGEVFSTVTADQICTPGYSTSVRDVPESEKMEAYAEYGITSHTTRQYEVDHLVSLELGGSNDIANLWPEAAGPVPGYHEKDKAENYLHDQVCGHLINLARAQQEIATNWLSIYNSLPSQYK